MIASSPAACRSPAFTPFTMSCLLWLISACTWASTPSAGSDSAVCPAGFVCSDGAATWIRKTDSSKHFSTPPLVSSPMNVDLASTQNGLYPCLISSWVASSNMLFMCSKLLFSSSLCHRMKAVKMPFISPSGSQNPLVFWHACKALVKIWWYSLIWITCVPLTSLLPFSLCRLDGP